MSGTEDTKFNKSAFIRARPNMKPAEIIAEAEKLGQVISPGTIWTLRSADKRKDEGKATKKAKAEGTALEVSKKVSKKVAKADVKPLNKSKFIRKYPKLTAGQIIEKAAALGHTITPATIYTLRSADKKSGVKAPKKVAQKASKKVKAKSSRVSGINHLRVERTPVQPPSAVSGRPSIAFDPSDPNARRFIAKALAAMA